MRAIKFITFIIARFTHVFVNLRVVNALRLPLRYFYYYWVSAEFRECGKECFFEGFSLLRGGKHITLGSGLYIGKDVVWEVYDQFNGQHFTPSLSFGDNSSFGDSGHITCINKISIGNGVRIGRKAFITDNSHGASKRELLDTPANKRPLTSKGPVIIEDNVWIGEMVCIMPGVTIGKGSIIAANSVVTHDIPAYSVAAGIPAKVVKQL
jgi:acetyltransferase-like isoleucine patch superfamily enzyme